MIDVVEVLVHWHAGRKVGELCSSLGVDPETVRKYVAPALAAGMVPGGPPLSEAVWSELVEGWFPELVDHSLRRTSWPEIEPHRERVKAWLGVVTVSTMHQRLRDDHGLAVSESSLRRYIAATFAEEAARGAVRVLRDTPPPGTEAQVDYGLLGRWTDPQSGRARRVWGFLMVLTFSRLLFLRPVIVMDEAAWVECHVAAFSFFGGVPRRVVYENVPRNIFVLDARRYPVHAGEGVDVPGQERLLGLGGERPMEGPARVAQPQREQPQLDRDPGDHRPELAEVDLGFDTGRVGLGHHGRRRRGDLGPEAPDVLAHGRLGDVRFVLHHEASEDPPGRVALLLRHRQVVGQPAAHGGLVGAERAGADARPAGAVAGRLRVPAENGH